MLRKSRVFFTPIAFLLLLTLFAYNLPSRPKTKPASEASCSAEKKGCPETGKGEADDLMMENLSRQFILVSPVN